MYAACVLGVFWTVASNSSVNASEGDPPRRSRPQTTLAQLEAETRSYAKKVARAELASAPSELTEKVDQPSSSLLHAQMKCWQMRLLFKHAGGVVFDCASHRDSPTDVWFRRCS